MMQDPYSPEVRALFDDPAHAGAVDGAYRADVEDQGLRISVFASLGNGSLAQLGFLAWGCPHVIAAAEAACRELEGQDPAVLLDFSTSTLMQSLSVPVEKTGRILVLEDAVRALGHVVRDALTDQED